jgi:hypothetical protein
MRNILIVEGPDDLLFIKRFCEECKITPEFEFLNTLQPPIEGFEQARKAFQNLIESSLRGSENISIGIIVDADDTKKVNRRDSLTDALQTSGFATGTEIKKIRDTLSGDAYLEDKSTTANIRVGIWIMPNNQDEGDLETFVASLVPEQKNNLLLKLAEESLVKAQSIATYKIPASKGLIYTYLAWQRQPGKPFWHKATTKYLDITVPEAQKLADWLTRLFA